MEPVMGPEWPRFPKFVLAGALREGVRVGSELERPYPVEPMPCAAKLIKRF